MVVWWKQPEPPARPSVWLRRPPAGSASGAAPPARPHAFPPPPRPPARPPGHPTARLCARPVVRSRPIGVPPGGWATWAAWVHGPSVVTPCLGASLGLAGKLHLVARVFGLARRLHAGMVVEPYQFLLTQRQGSQRHLAHLARSQPGACERVSRVRGRPPRAHKPARVLVCSHATMCRAASS